MMRRLVVAAALLLAACAASPQDEGTLMDGSRAQRVPMGDGTDTWAIECNGAANTIALCYRRAAAVCNGAFTPIDANQTTTGGTGWYNPATGTVHTMQGVNRLLLVRCNN